MTTNPDPTTTNTGLTMHPQSQHTLKPPNKISIYNSTMSQDRTHFIPQQHDMAPAPFAYNMTQMHPIIPSFSQTFSRHAMVNPNNITTSHYQTVPNVTNPTQETLTDSSDEKLQPASTNSIINNAEDIIQKGNHMFLHNAQGGINSNDSIPTLNASFHTHMGSSLPSNVTPPMPHIQVPQPPYYPHMGLQPYPPPPPTYTHANPLQNNSILNQLLEDNKKLQETLLTHMSEYEQQINLLLKQNETLQHKLQKSMEQKENSPKKSFKCRLIRHKNMFQLKL